jgi:predicted ribosomally synthesized peptide with SipW-like signal peptide
MTNGTHAARGRKIKPIALIISIILVAGLAIAGTTAWLTNKTNSVTNSFTPGKVTTDITEDLKGNTKSNIKVQNTGNVDAYVRASVVMNWVDASGNVVADSTLFPTLTISNNNWVKGTDGYYYYKVKVAPTGSTEVMLEPITVTDPNNNGNHLQVTILAEGIQADGVDSSNTPAVEVAWGNVVSVNANGTLTVAEA